jgi:hypothetical protein
VASPALAQQSAHEDTLTHTLIGATMVAHFADISTTMYCVGRGDCHEANPALRWAQDRPIAMAVVKGSIATASAGRLLKYHKEHPKAARWTAVAITVAISWLSYRNATHSPGALGILER